MNDELIGDAARSLARWLEEMLDKSMAPEIKLAREEALLGQRSAHADP